MSGVSTFTQEMADAICNRLVGGESLRSICLSEGMPTASTVFKWLRDHPPFSEQYALAREAQADTLFDEMLDIADDGSNDWLKANRQDDDETAGWRVNGEAIQRSKLRIDARRWMASKLQPKKYGDKVSTELTGKDGGPIEVEHASGRQSFERRIAGVAARYGATSAAGKSD